VREPGRSAIGTWSGGRFLHYGETVDEERFEKLLRPGGGIETVLSADTYGQGEADALLGRALKDVPRRAYSLVGAIGHDFYEGERDGPRGFPRFTDPRLRGEGEYSSYLQMAAERSLERLGAERFDLLLLHNPDRIGYTSEAVWDGGAA
jgi:aryl-alcohol dehydrogenase-like predicted oxidoreductase